MQILKLSILQRLIYIGEDPSNQNVLDCSIILRSLAMGWNKSKKISKEEKQYSNLSKIFDADNNVSQINWNYKSQSLMLRHYAQHDI